MSLPVKHTNQKDNLVQQFYKRYPTKVGKERALKKMSNSQIDKLVSDCGTAQGRMYFQSFKSGGKKK